MASKQVLNSRVTVMGMPLDVTVDDMEKFFSRAGTIRTDPSTGLLQIERELRRAGPGQPETPSGCGSVTFQTVGAAERAVELFDEKEFTARSHCINVWPCYTHVGPRANIPAADWKRGDKLTKFWIEEEAMGNPIPDMGSPAGRAELALKINMWMLEEKWMDQTERELVKERRKKQRDGNNGYLDKVRVRYLLHKDRIKEREEREAREVMDGEERQENQEEQEKRREME